MQEYTLIEALLTIYDLIGKFTTLCVYLAYGFILLMKGEFLAFLGWVVVVGPFGALLAGLLWPLTLLFLLS